MLQEAKICQLQYLKLIKLTPSPLQVTGTAKALREFSLLGQTATGGLNGCWKIFTAKAKKEGKPSTGPAPVEELCTANCLPCDCILQTTPGRCITSASHASMHQLVLMRH